MKRTRVRRKRRPSPPAQGWTIGYAIGALITAVRRHCARRAAQSRRAATRHRRLGPRCGDVAALVPLHRRRRFTASALGLRPAPPARSVGLVVLAVIAVAVVNAVWLRGVLGLKEPAAQGITLHESTAAAIFTGLAIAVCAPVSEEIFSADSSIERSETAWRSRPPPSSTACYLGDSRDHVSARRVASADGVRGTRVPLVRIHRLLVSGNRLALLDRRCWL